MKRFVVTEITTQARQFVVMGEDMRDAINAVELRGTKIARQRIVAEEPVRRSFACFAIETPDVDEVQW